MTDPIADMLTRIRNANQNRASKVEIPASKVKLEIAKILNMSQTGYSKYEVGTNDIPTKILIKLAQFYNTSVDYLLGLTDNKKPY